VTVFFLIGLFQPVPAVDWYVATNGTGLGTNGWASATNSIQGAISASTAGDTIWVSNGVYDSGGVANYPAGKILTNRVAITKAITLRSQNNDPANTIIKGARPNGPAAVRCVYIAAVAAKLIGFTITNGGTLATTAQYDSGGGGVFCDGYSQAPVISNCIITGNSANGEASRFGGGGTYCGTLRNCQLIGNTSVKEGGASWLTAMYNCLLIGNSAGTHGGGASEGNLYNCTLTGNSAGSWGGGGYNNVLLDNCTFISNSATLYGGGAAEFTTVYNCKLIGNSASDCGGGAFIGSSGGKMYNCLVVGNSSGTIGGGFYSGALYNSTVIGNKAGTGGGGTYGSAQYNSIIYFNTSTSGGANYDHSASYFIDCCTIPTNTLGTGWSAGNITNDPVFVGNGSNYGTNHIAGNYRLAARSPCINTGTNYSWMTDSADTRSKDLDNRQRLRYGSVDMGVYENIRAGTLYGFR